LEKTRYRELKGKENKMGEDVDKFELNADMLVSLIRRLYAERRKLR